MNLLRRFKDHILGPYAGSDYVLQRNAQALFYFSLILSVITFVFFLVYAIWLPERLAIAGPSFLTVFLSSQLNIFLLSRGRYQLAAHAMVLLTGLIFIVAQFRKIGPEAHTGYNSFFYMMMVVQILAAMFARKRYIIIVSVVFLLVNVAFFILSQPYLSEKELVASKVGMISTIFSMVTAMWLLFLLRSVLDRALALAHEQTLQNQQQFEKLQKIMASSDLFNSVSLSSGEMQQIGQSMHAFSQEINQNLLRITTSLDKTHQNTLQIDQAAQEQSQVVREVTERSVVLSEQLNVFNQTAAKYSANIRKTLEEIQSSVEKARQTVEATAEVKKNTDQIALINTTIQNIAEKVNMLSLNASIEAARAGAHGRGFAVVASEISKLAERTSASAANISVLVKQETTSVDKASELISELTKKFMGIAENISEMESFLESVNHSSQEGDLAASQIRTAMQNLATGSKDVTVATNRQVEAGELIKKELDFLQTEARKLEQNSAQLAEVSRQLEGKSAVLKQQIVDV